MSLQVIRSVVYVIKYTYTPLAAAYIIQTIGLVKSSIANSNILENIIRLMGMYMETCQNNISTLVESFTFDGIVCDFNISTLVESCRNRYLILLNTQDFSNISTLVETCQNNISTLVETCQNNISTLIETCQNNITFDIKQYIDYTNVMITLVVILLLVDIYMRHYQVEPTPVVVEAPVTAPKKAKKVIKTKCVIKSKLTSTRRWLRIEGRLVSLTLLWNSEGKLISMSA